MAREIESIERRVGLNPVQLPQPSGGQQLINALQGFGKVVGGVVEGIATEQAAIQGILDRESGKEVNLAPGITRPTSAYNKAYRDTDARIVGRSGLDMIAEAITEATNPLTMNSSSAENYNAKVEGIIEGTLSQAREENRGAIKDSLLRAASIGRSKVQTAVYNLEGEQIKKDFKVEYNLLKEDRTAAILAKDNDRLQIVDDQIDKLFTDWGNLSEEIFRSIPALNTALKEEETKARWLGEFIEAQGQGQGATDKFLDTFTTSKIEGLREQDKVELISQMVRINNATKSAQYGAQALSMQQLENEIDNPQSPNHITTQDELENTAQYQALTPLQQQQITHKLIVRNNQGMKKQQDIAKALQDIADGRAAFVKKSLIDEMFITRLDEIEGASGRKADLQTQFNIVRSFQTNVPKFDALISDMLTNGDTNTALAAGDLYSTARIAKQDNYINLSGDAATIAEKLTTQFNFTSNPPEDVVKGILKQVLERDQPQVVERLNAATKAFSKNGSKYYREVMGVEPDPFTDQGAYAVFKDAFISAMVRGNTQDEAARITRNSMKAWGSDKWFPDDTVSIAPPTRMLPMSEGNFNIRNQIILQFNAIKDANNALITPESGTLPMRFTREFTIPNKMDDVDFVYKPIDEFKAGKNQIFALREDDLLSPKNIEVEVNGVKSNLKLISSPQTLATPSTGLVYGIFAQDKFGIYQQLSDPRSADGLAYIVLNDVNITAPGVAGENADKRLISTLESARSQQRRAELEDIYMQEVENRPASRKFIDFIRGETPATDAKVKARFKELFERVTREKVKPEEIKGIIDKERAQRLEDNLNQLLGNSNKGKE